ncbi:MAG: hypothetical protein D6675_11365 [Gemmatimonadetes bacterium]|nr:MAG: hypothetical protein D6675_11365 [Gemmatimonadota bacterium]
MNDIDLKDPVIQVLLVMILLILGVAYGGYNYLLSPAKAEVVKKQEELSKLQNDLDQVRAVANRLPMIQQELDKLNEKWEDVSARLPSKKQVARLIVQLTNTAVTRNVTIKEIRPAPVTSGGSAVVETHPFQIKATSTYHDLAEFFADVANFKRIVKVEKISIQPFKSNESDQNIQVDFTVNAFAFKEGMAPPGGSDSDGGEVDEFEDW